MVLYCLDVIFFLLNAYLERTRHKISYVRDQSEKMSEKNVRYILTTYMAAHIDFMYTCVYGNIYKYIYTYIYLYIYMPDLPWCFRHCEQISFTRIWNKRVQQFLNIMILIRIKFEFGIISQGIAFQYAKYVKQRLCKNQRSWIYHFVSRVTL